MGRGCASKDPCTGAAEKAHGFPEKSTAEGPLAFLEERLSVSELWEQHSSVWTICILGVNPACRVKALRKAVVDGLSSHSFQLPFGVE